MHILAQILLRDGGHRTRSGGPLATSLALEEDGPRNQALSTGLYFVHKHFTEKRRVAFSMSYKGPSYMA